MQEVLQPSSTSHQRLCCVAITGLFESIGRTGRLLLSLFCDLAPVQLACYFIAMSAQKLWLIQLHVYKHVHMPQ